MHHFRGTTPVHQFLTSKKYDKTIADSSLIRARHGQFLFNTCFAIVFLISRISFNIKRGSFVAIVGHVGAGKSSLMNALLGELHKTHGRVSVCVSIQIQVHKEYVGWPLQHECSKTFIC